MTNNKIFNNHTSGIVLGKLKRRTNIFLLLFCFITFNIHSVNAQNEIFGLAEPHNSN